MPRHTELDKRWQDLMSLCAREKEYQAEQRHPRLLRFITKQIDQLASELGFSDSQSRRREFRAERSGNNITRIIKD